MLKIIDVPEKGSIHVFDEDVNLIQEHSCKDLKDYNPEPLTADGLTLREFAYKAKGNMSNVQRFDRESMEWKDCHDNLPRVALDMISIPEIMEIYRIKPEVVHYKQAIDHYACGEHVIYHGIDTSEKSKVTCPDCIAAMNQKYKPWDF